MTTEFRDRLASRLKIGKDAPHRRAIERVLGEVKTRYENGQCGSPPDAEREFRGRVEAIRTED
jgi:hypothetical protein